jgi:hypothetical protein
MHFPKNAKRAFQRLSAPFSALHAHLHAPREAQIAPFKQVSFLPRTRAAPPQH